jgi:alanyl-tRNA synthetase
MNTAEIRTRFVDFFTARQHVHVPSASLIPPDPTLLLTSAGMVQFKPYMLGEEKPPYPRAVTIQKVARTSDIDIIGTTARHMTFFEMLGNFSFGDYFKEDAIKWAYEFVTEALGFDVDRLWYTVYTDDDEAAEIWLDGVGVPEERLQRRERDNFWQMGVPGPCGPASEIFYDKGPEYGEDGGPAVDEERFMEFWNLVFMQNLQDEPYHVVGDLPNRNIDTGAGLERVASLLQGKDSLFEVDSVWPVLEAGMSYLGRGYGEDEQIDVTLRILADHGRAMTFLIGDGVVPSNDGRGHILRRLIRRAVRRAWMLDGTEDLTPILVDSTIDALGAAYPGLVQDRSRIVETAAREEAAFRRTLATGIDLLEGELAAAGGSLSGAAAFKLHDTYGFPIEVTTEIAAEKGVTVDLAGFDTAMQQQRERAQKAWKGAAAAAEAESYRSLLDQVGLTDFVGYDLEENTAMVVALMRAGEAVSKLTEGEEGELFLNQTVFYGESGGQVGDTGTVQTETGTVSVFDTQHVIQGLHAHRVKVANGHIEVDQTAQAFITGDRRERISKSHTGTHILHAVLRAILGDHATQAGSLVEAGRLRFDFTHPKAVSEQELREVERVVNERVIENARVRAFTTSRQEAAEMGALAFFGDKYGETVRVVEAGDYSRELCGGTHTYTTGQVGPVILVSEGSIGSNMRRVEALTGAAAYEHVTRLRNDLRAVADTLNSPVEQVKHAAGSLMARLAEQEERLGAFEDQHRSRAAEVLAADAERAGEHAIVVASVPEATPDNLRLLAGQVLSRIDEGVVVLGANRGGKAALVATVTPGLTTTVSAAHIVRLAAEVVGGGGGGDDELAQAGGPDGAAIDEALERAGKELRALLG